MSNPIRGAGGCFKKGTLIQQENGITIPIEELQVGDTVLSFDDKNNTYRAKVIKTHLHTDPQPILHVKFWGGELFITPNHWVVNQLGAFVEVGTLTEEDALQDGLGHLRPIISMEVIAYEEVYNLTVEPWHTFIANNIRVHNGGHRESYPTITGAGGGSKGGGGRPAQEAPNTLKSTQYAELIDVISEGEIQGLVNGAKSIYLDGVPLENADGTANYYNVAYSLRTGTQNQDPVPSALTGVSSTLGNPNSGNEIKFGPTFAQEISITNTNVKSVDVTIAIPSLTSQDTSTGDLNGTSVSFKIFIKTANTAYSVVHDTSISGKCTALYQKSYSVKFLTAQPSDYPILIKVERTKEDATTSAVQDKMYWYSYTEHIPTILRYPNSALINFKIDAEQFSNVPTRGYEIYGIKIRVPTNYNPVTRVYTGEWDGTFKVAWSNNPAWVFYDLIVEDRYGLGGYMNQDNVDKWSLYTIAKYCDEQVPTGFKEAGTTLYEPRFTCNIFIYSQEDAYRLLASIASVFRAIQYWALGQFSLSADMPKDPIMSFTPSNVIDGQFSYAGSSLKTRHTVAVITWNDPADQYKQKVEYVEDIEGINRYGVIQTDAIAFGCTSRGQAHRLGKWLLYSEQMETETITFKTGIENCIMLPGDIIQSTDPFRAGERYGGRVVGFQPTNTLLLDKSPPDGNYSISLFTPNKDATSGNLRGKITVITASVSNGVVSTYDTAAQTVTPESVWVAANTGNIEPEYWRIIGIKEEDDHISAVITALEYRVDKFAHVEQDLVLEERPTSTINYSKPSTPVIPLESENTWVKEYLYYAAPNVLANAVSLSWAGDSLKYKVKYSGDSGATWSEIISYTPNVTIKPIEPKTYLVEIYAINSLNRQSDALARTIVLLGKQAPPLNVTGLSITNSTSGISVSWGSNKDSDIYTYPDLDLDGYEIRELYSVSIHPSTKLVNNTAYWKTASELGMTDQAYLNHLNSIWDDRVGAKAESGLLKNTTYLDLSVTVGYNYFLVKAVDDSGNYSSKPELIGIYLKGPSSANVNTLVSKIDNEDLVINWERPTSDTSIDRYVLTIDGKTFTSYTEELRTKAWFIGTKTLDIIPYDKAGNSAAKVSKDITIESNLSPQNLSYSIIDDLATEVVINDSFKLTWREQVPPGLSLPIKEYEVRTDQNWGQALGLLGRSKSSFYTSKVTWGGTKRIYVAGIVSNSTYTTSAYADINIVSPSAPINIVTKVVDNNVLFYWQQPTSGSLPIKEYELRKGSTYATAEIVGTKAGLFTTIFETVGGEYTYWISAIDTADNYGTPAQTIAKVNQPPDYVLQYDRYSDFINAYGTNGSITKTNSSVNSLGRLVIPSPATETWAEHFINYRTTNVSIVSGGSGYTVGTTVQVNGGTSDFPAVLTVSSVSGGVVTACTITNLGSYNTLPSANTATTVLSGSGTGLTVTLTGTAFTTIDGQLASGNTAYIQPVPYIGTYVEVLDYGTVLPGNAVTIILNRLDLVAGGTFKSKIESSLDNTNWTTLSTTNLAVYASNFRYIRVTLEVTGTGVQEISMLNIKLDSKLKTISGTATVAANSSGGQLVYLTNDGTSTGTKVFKDVQSITLTTAYISGRQAIAVYDFADSADPLSFVVYLYDSLSGEIMNVSATCSYTVRGV